MNKLLFAILALGLTSKVSAQIWDFDGVNKLPGSVNTDLEESIPVLSKDNTNLYFIRSFDENNKGGKLDQDIWVSSRQTDGSYSN